MNIQTFKKLGWHVDVIHQRKHNLIFPYPNTSGVKKVLSPRGGQTTVVLTDPFHTTYSGVAHCNESDNYCKDTGRKIALARAMVQIPQFRDKVPNLFL